jgi:hypothetical protein
MSCRAGFSVRVRYESGFGCLRARFVDMGRRRKTNKIKRHGLRVGLTGLNIGANRAGRPGPIRSLRGATFGLETFCKSTISGRIRCRSEALFKGSLRCRRNRPDSDPTRKGSQPGRPIFGTLALLNKTEYCGRHRDRELLCLVVVYSVCRI